MPLHWTRSRASTSTSGPTRIWNRLTTRSRLPGWSASLEPTGWTVAAVAVAVGLVRRRVQAPRSPGRVRGAQVLRAGGGDGERCGGADVRGGQEQRPLGVGEREGAVGCVGAAEAVVVDRFLDLAVRVAQHSGHRRG